jgi:hypothetical protein
MQKLYISPTRNTPEINFSPEENLFLIRGTSSPEDVRAMYYPVIEWFRAFATMLSENNHSSDVEPLTLKMDLVYFNSSSAKFIYDILVELKNIAASGTPVVIEWYYEHGDYDLKDAGEDISNIAEIPFTFIEKN